MGWLRNFVRKRINPANPEHALRMRRILSGLYFFASWNILAYSIYFLIKHRNPKTLDEQENPSKYYHRILGGGEARVIKFRGFTKTDEYAISAVDKSKPERPREGKGHDEDLELLVEETSSL